MKKLFMVPVLFLFLPSISLAAITSDLQYGSRGIQVSELQDFLIDQQLLRTEPTGNFYSLTLAAVKDFQYLNGITPVSGYVGPKTRAKINEILSRLGVSETGVSNEEGVVVPPANQNGELQAQLKALQDQVFALQQAQQASLNAIQNNTNKIVQNTTPNVPVVVPTPPPTPVVPKVIKPKIITIRSKPYSYGLKNEAGEIVNQISISKDLNSYGDYLGEFIFLIGDSGGLITDLVMHDSVFPNGTVPLPSVVIMRGTEKLGEANSVPSGDGYDYVFQMPDNQFKNFDGVRYVDNTPITLRAYTQVPSNAPLGSTHTLSIVSIKPQFDEEVRIENAVTNTQVVVE